MHKKFGIEIPETLYFLMFGTARLAISVLCSTELVRPGHQMVRLSK